MPSIVRLMIVLSIFHLMCCKSDKQSESQKSPGEDQWKISAEQVTEEEYNIFNVLLNEPLIKKETKLVVIDRKTTGMNLLPIMSGKMEENLPDPSTELDKSTINNFLLVNQTRYSLQYKFNLKLRYILVDSELEKLREGLDENKSYWSSFYEAYPNSQGLISLSRIGFGLDKQQALVYYGNIAGETSGSGAFFLLEKINNHWRTKHVITVWIS